MAEREYWWVVKTIAEVLVAVMFYSVMGFELAALIMLVTISWTLKDLYDKPVIQFTTTGKITNGGKNVDKMVI